MVRMFFVALIILAFGHFSHGDAHAQASLDLRGNVGGSGIPGGSIIPGYDSATCDGTIEGAIRYDSATSCAEFCDGSDWTCPSGGGVSGPPGSDLDWSLAGGSSHTCLVRAVSQASCWGSGAFGSLGNGSTGDQTRPAQIHTDTGTPGWNDWVSIDAYFSFGCGVRENGTAWCWGINQFGELGIGATGQRTRPVQVHTDTGTPGWSDWASVGLGQYHTCGVRADGTAWCWGNGTNGRLGNADTGQQTRPVQVHTDVGTPGWSDWVEINPGRSYSCGVRENGTAWCWGRGSGGVLGNGDTADQTRPVQVHTDTGAPGWSDWRIVTGSNQAHTCGIREGGTAWCWGSPSNGALGNGTSSGDQTRPVQVHTDTGLPGWSDWVTISAGFYHTCGIRQNGTAWCWGTGSSGTLGNGDTVNQTRPVQVHTDAGAPGWSDWIDIEAGSSHTCGVRANGSVWCWGNGANGRLGNADTADQTRPVPVVGM